MNLNIKGKKFLILGASSGFGRHVAQRVHDEGGLPVLVARSEDALKDFKEKNASSSVVCADLFSTEGLSKVLDVIEATDFYGVLINAGGPPAGSFPMDDMAQWDQGYDVVLRWKIELLRTLVPRLESSGSGRIVFIESVSVRQPIDGLILSNVFRMAVVGLMKSMVNEMDQKDVLMNILAPGYHRTNRLENLIAKQSEEQGRSETEIADNMAANTPVKKLGDPASFAELAVWLLSPQNQYVTGQIIPVDGGLAKGV